jgi:hypothetical protein
MLGHAEADGVAELVELTVSSDVLVELARFEEVVELARSEEVVELAISDEVDLVWSHSKS